MDDRNLGCGMKNDSHRFTHALTGQRVCALYSNMYSEENMYPDNGYFEEEFSLESTQEIHPSGCFLARLPKVARWKIFGYLSEYIGEVELVSKSWRTMINEWRVVPENLPELLLIDVFEASPDSMNVIIECRRWEFPCFAKIRELATVPCFSEIEACMDITIDIPFDGDLLERLRSALSTKSRIVHITRNAVQYDGSRFFSAVNRLLQPVKRAAEFTFNRQNVNSENSQFLLDLSSKFSSSKMSIMVDCLDYCREFLLQISERIDSIVIKVTKNNNEDAVNKHWVDLVLAMFNRGASSIEVKNHEVAIFTPDDVRRIAESMKSRGEPFHFQTIVHKEPRQLVIPGLRIGITAFGPEIKWIVDVSSQPPPSNAVIF